MGNTFNKRDSLERGAGEKLGENTKATYTKAELAMYESFMKEHPDGVITKETFRFRLHTQYFSCFVDKV